MQNLRGAWRTEDHSRTCVIQDSVTVIWTVTVSMQGHRAIPESKCRVRDFFSARKRDLNGELERTRNPGKYSQ